MPTLTKQPKKSHRKPETTPGREPDKGPTVLLHTNEEVAAYLAAHLTPVRYGPIEQPIYANEDRVKLNCIIRPGC